MALYWNWKEQCGTATFTQSVGGEEREFELCLYTGNAYLIMLLPYKDGETQKYDMFSFWVDKKHMQNCLGITKGHENIYADIQTFKRFRLDGKKCRYWKQIAPALKQAFPDVVVEVY